MKLTKITLLLLILLGCSDSAKRGYDYYIGYKRKNVILEKINHFAICETGENFIGIINNVKFRRGSIIISDYVQPILLFIDPRSGKIIKNVKFKSGKGPGEVLVIENFDVTSDKIYIYDRGNLRFSVFDTLGNYVKSVPWGINADLLIAVSGEFIVRDNKIYVHIIENRYNNERTRYKSKVMAVLDTSFNVLKTFGVMDKIYQEVKVYLTATPFCFDSLGNIYYTQSPTYRIYKYDNHGNLVKIFGVKESFKLIEEDVPIFESPQKLTEVFARYSWNIKLSYLHKDSGYILQNFHSPTPEFYQTRDFLKSKHYLRVYDIDGNYVTDINLPGIFLTVGVNNEIYVLENDEPGNREIGVYKFKVMD